MIDKKSFQDLVSDVEGNFEIIVIFPQGGPKTGDRGVWKEIPGGPPAHPHLGKDTQEKHLFCLWRKQNFSSQKDIFSRNT